MDEDDMPVRGSGNKLHYAGDNISIIAVVAHLKLDDEGVRFGRPRRRGYETHAGF